MRHQKSGKKLGRTPSHRKALFRNMVTSLLQHEKIVTTETKAKEIGRLAEKMITLGKKGDLHSRRQAIAYIKSNEVVKKVFTQYAERYKARQGGYTRVLKLEPRSGDNAPMAMLELVDRPIKEKTAKEEKSSTKAPRKAPAKKKAEKPKKSAAKPEDTKAGKEKPAAGKKADGDKKPSTKKASGKTASTVKKKSEKQAKEE